MILTVAGYKAWVGSTTATDPQIEGALLRNQALMEGYCQRRFDLVGYSETYRCTENPLQLNNWPLVFITSVAVDSEDVSVGEDDVDKRAGLVYHNHLWSGKVVKTMYSAGYSERDMPHELKVVLATLTEGFLASGAAGVSPVSKETVFGVSAVEYARAADLDRYAALGPYAELGPYVSILDKYVRTSIL